MSLPPSRKIRVLVVDDSALNRQHLIGLLDATGEVLVVGEAEDGQEALRSVFKLRPDAVTLDIEMPRMDGFTFLRLLMSKQPTPVIVVSQHSEKQNVFKALEFGAVDFVEKPSKWTAVDTAQLQAQLLQKMLLVRSLIAEQRPLRRTEPSLRTFSETEPRSIPPMPLRYVVAIASSAGGPAALLEVFSQLPERMPVAVLVAQHMPERFTATFAQRLQYRSRFRVSEARDGDRVRAQTAFICPGNRCMELETEDGTGDLVVRVRAPRPTDRYVPSADRLLQSVATVVGIKAIGVVLTGMGDDGALGAAEIKKNRGVVVVESRETAVVPGMPTAAAGSADHVLPLGEIGRFLSELGGQRSG